VKGYLAGIIDRSNLWQKNRSRKIVEEKSRQKNRGKKITATKHDSKITVWQQNRA
jgi:hypothetical protein